MRQKSEDKIVMLIGQLIGFVLISGICLALSSFVDTTNKTNAFSVFSNSVKNQIDQTVSEFGGELWKNH